MNDKDKHFIERYEELLDKGYCNCNEMNCIDNNSPRRILDIVKQLQSNWNCLREWITNENNNYHYGLRSGKTLLYGKFLGRADVLDKMNELEGDKDNV